MVTKSEKVMPGMGHHFWQKSEREREGDSSGLALRLCRFLFDISAPIHRDTPDWKKASGAVTENAVKIFWKKNPVREIPVTTSLLKVGPFSLHTLTHHIDRHNPAPFGICHINWCRILWSNHLAVPTTWSNHLEVVSAFYANFTFTGHLVPPAQPRQNPPKPQSISTWSYLYGNTSIRVTVQELRI